MVAIEAAISWMAELRDFALSSPNLRMANSFSISMNFSLFMGLDMGEIPFSNKVG
jgi:hypothetical protein